MKVNIKMEDGTETVVDAIGRIAISNGHACFENDETYYDATIETISSISDGHNETMKRIGDAVNYPNSIPIVLTKHGTDDWEVYYPCTDFSMRGTKKDALDEIKDLLDVNDKGGK